MTTFHGAFTAIITPFTGEGLDEERLKEQVERQITEGIDGVVPCGTTGESPTLSHSEHRDVIRLVVEQAAGRVPVIAGTGSNSTREAIALSRYADEVGVDGLLVITPYYNKPTQEGLRRHFLAVAQATETPIILYNVPGRTGVNLEVETVRRLVEHPRIVAIKEASGSLEQASRLAAIEGLQVLSGDDGNTLPILSVGGVGVISVISNILPGAMARLVRYAREGNLQEARALHRRLHPLCEALFVETNPGPVKMAMALLGLDSGRLRLPLVTVRDETRELLRRRLEELDLEMV